MESLEFSVDPRYVLEEVERFSYAHVQHIENALSSVFDLECLPVVSFPLTNFAWHIYIRQKMHLDLDDAVALTGFAASAFDVEAESALFKSTHLGVRKRCEKISDIREHSRIRRRVGPRRTADRRLVYIYDFVDV